MELIEILYNWRSPSRKTQTGELAEVRMTGERITGTINIVYTNGQGYSINLDPRGNVNYTAEVRST